MLGACLAAHVIAAQVIPSPWWVPNLTLMGLVLASGRSPRHAGWFGACAGLAAMLWAARAIWLVLLGSLLAGLAIHRLGVHWNLNEPRVQVSLTGLLMAVLMAVTLWLDQAWSVPVVGLAVVQVMVTGATLWVLRTSVGHD